MSGNQRGFMVWPSRYLQTSAALQEENQQKQTCSTEDEGKKPRGSDSEIRSPTTSKSTEIKCGDNDNSILQCLEEVPQSPSQIQNDTIKFDSHSLVPVPHTHNFNTSSEDLGSAGGCPYGSAEKQSDRGWADLKSLSPTQSLNQQHDKVIDLCTRSHDYKIVSDTEESKNIGTSSKGESGNDESVKGDIKRDITFWVKRGLSNEGIELNEMKLLNKLTPNYILKEYFTKVQAYLYPEAMPPRIRKNLEELYEKVYDKPLSADSSISIKFARAFLAQEKKGNLKFNWASFAWKEYIRITNRAALKSRNSPSSSSIREQDQDEQDDEEAQGNANASPPIVRTEDRVSLQSAADAHLQSLRADLQWTHKTNGSLQEFDSLVSSFLSEQCLQDRAQADIRREKEKVTLSLSSAQRQCILLRPGIQEVEGKIRHLEALVREAVDRLQDVKARKPVVVNDSNFPIWKAWCTELQKQCSKLGYFRMELQEQESAFNKLRLDLEAAVSQQRNDTHAMDLLTQRAAHRMVHTSYHVAEANTTESKKRKCQLFDSLAGQSFNNS